MVLLVLLGASFARAERVRTFDFTYEATITGLDAGKIARVWLPRPRNSAEQRIEVLHETFPTPPILDVDRSGRNSLYYFQSPAGTQGTLHFSVTYRITRHEVTRQAANGDISAYLKPDKLVPVGGHSAILLAGQALPSEDMALAKKLYDLIDDRMEYRKDKPGWGRGDASWACDSRFGNCTDFHSLFMSLARTRNLPAKFEIGFSIPQTDGPAEVNGYHCWAFFKPKGGDWIPVDISEANKHPEKRGYYFGHLDADRVTFSTGRDLMLSPPQAGSPLNFFIYPYVEVDGRAYPAEKIRHVFHIAPISEKH